MACVRAASVRQILPVKIVRDFKFCVVLVFFAELCGFVGIGNDDPARIALCDLFSHFFIDEVIQPVVVDHDQSAIDELITLGGGYVNTFNFFAMDKTVGNVVVDLLES